MHPTGEDHGGAPGERPGSQKFRDAQHLRTRTRAGAGAVRIRPRRFRAPGRDVTSGTIDVPTADARKAAARARVRTGVLLLAGLLVGSSTVAGTLRAPADEARPGSGPVREFRPDESRPDGGGAKPADPAGSPTPSPTPEPDETPLETRLA